MLLDPAVRLLTLTGPGGAGKTRLALEVARQLCTAFPQGVYLVSLAPITDPALVLATVGQALGVVETPSRTLLESIRRAWAMSRCCCCWTTSSRSALQPHASPSPPPAAG